MCSVWQVLLPYKMNSVDACNTSQLECQGKVPLEQRQKVTSLKERKSIKQKVGELSLCKVTC
jgi:hypothetical protein